MANQTARYLVTGASGQLGALVLAALAKKVPAANIVALVRRPEAAAPLEAQGVEVRIGDYDDPAALEKAFQGIDRLLLISATEMGKRIRQHENAVAAAKKAGVGFIAYTSILKAETSPLSLAEEHLATEIAIEASGIPHAHLRNGWYTENKTGSVAPAIEHGAYAGAAGDGRFSTAPRQDYAEAAAVVLSADTPEAAATYELAGDESFSMAEFAAALSDAAGSRVAYADMSEADYAAMLEGVGLPGPLAAMLADSDAGAAVGALQDDTKTLSRLIGRPTTHWTVTLAAAVKAPQAA